jgi:hypothetical protein
MSGVNGLGSNANQANGTNTNTSLTPLQRAQALAQSIASAGGANSSQQVRLLAATMNSALGATLATALWSSATSTGYGPAYNVSNGVYSPALNALDRAGSATLGPQWQQIRTPAGNTPGISHSVSLAHQVSYLQTVTPSDSTASHTIPSLGTIGTNAGRLVLLGSLSSGKNDVQTYSFNLQQEGKLHIMAPDPHSSDPTASLGPVHMQVYDSSGALVADSDPKSGLPYLTYVKLDQTALAGPDLQKGQYTVRLSYKSTAPANAKGDYSLFIESGTDPGRVTYYTTTTSLSATSPSATGASTSSAPGVSLLV